MNEQDFIKVIEDAKSAHPFWFELSGDKPVISLRKIENIEQKKGVVYPDEYKSFVTRYGAGEFAFTNVFSPMDDGEWSSWVQKAEYKLPENFIPISENGCGDYLGFLVVAGRCSDRLYWADHEQEYNVSTVPAFDSFYQFIIKLGLNT